MSRFAELVPTDNLLLDDKLGAGVTRHYDTAGTGTLLARANFMTSTA